MGRSLIPRVPARLRQAAAVLWTSTRCSRRVRLASRWRPHAPSRSPPTASNPSAVNDAVRSCAAAPTPNGSSLMPARPVPPLWTQRRRLTPPSPPSTRRGPDRRRPGADRQAVATPRPGQRSRGFGAERVHPPPRQCVRARHRFVDHGDTARLQGNGRRCPPRCFSPPR